VRVVGYARLSAASEESTSVARQREIIQKHAAARGWELVGIEEDPVASATKLRLNRPGLNRARAALESGAADAILVWRLDRIARSVVDFGTLLDEGVPIVSCTEPLDTTTSMGRAMAEILQVFAAMEARATAARVSSSIAYLRRNRRFAGGRVPYGYRTAPNPDGPGRVLEPNPETAGYVREAVDRALAGETLYAISQDFNARGVPTALKGSKGWSNEAVRSVLVGDAILGRVVHKGEVVRDEHGLPEEVWPAIVTVEESRRLRAALARRRRGQSRRKSSRLLSGLIVCGTCGRNLTVQNYAKGHAVYRCPARAQFEPCASPANVQCRLVEAEVERRFLAVVGRFEVVEEVVLAPEPAELAQVEEALRDTAAALTAPGADVASLVERLTALRARREEIEARPELPESTLIETGRTFAQEWAARADDDLGRRRILGNALEAVVVAPAERRAWDPRRIELVWSAGGDAGGDLE
jgi:DNA invertase Pin-like site-specific DNA recombinase